MLQRKAVLNDEQLDLLLTAISEALLNVSHHAYEDDAFKDDLLLLKGKRWWQCAWFNPEENRVVFIVCDLGLGIFKSFMPDDDGLSTQNEVSSVERAMLVGESRFVGSGRGNGSEDIKRPIGVGCVDDETLLILTGHARYNYNSNDSCPRCERLTEYIPELYYSGRWFPGDDFMRNIVIAKEFSRTPFGRYTTDSPNSAERFRRDFLVPALKGEEKEVIVDFRGIALGVGSSFLEEAFGGLIRKEGLPKANIKARLVIKSDVPFYKEQIEKFIDMAQPERA